MRDILFRGKRMDNGEWVEGYLAGYGLICPNEPEDTHNATGDYYGQTPYVGFVEVDPATVGQHTGLTDKNGNRIFEGDILRDVDGGIQTVIFDRGAFCGRYVGYTFNDDEFYRNEVVGNIRDNPELLEVTP